MITLLIFAFGLPIQAQQVAYEGSFRADSRWTTFEGNWSIVEENDRLMVVFADNFEAKKAPDLKIFLSKLTFEHISGKNAADPVQSVLIAPLNTYEGQMKFEIPTTIDPSEYQSIIVHCEKYAKLWGGSPLQN